MAARRRRRLLIGIPSGLVAVLALVALAQTARWARAENERQRVEAAAPLAPLALAATRHLEILPLVEADTAVARVATEHGVAYLVRTDGATVLLDLGFNQAAVTPSTLRHNMDVLGVSLGEIDAFVISHPHPDHMGGINAWRRNTLAFGKDPIELGGRPLYVPEPIGYPGAEPIVSDEPTVVAPAIATTGTIAFANPFPVGLLRPRAEEQALAVNVAGRGIVLVTGCGHPGLERMVARAQALFAEPIVGVVGGLHYEDASADALAPHLAFLRGLEPQLVALSPHDSSAAVIASVRAAFPGADRDVAVGAAIVLDAPGASAAR